MEPTEFVVKAEEALEEDLDAGMTPRLITLLGGTTEYKLPQPFKYGSVYAEPLRIADDDHQAAFF